MSAGQLPSGTTTAYTTTFGAPAVNTATISQSPFSTGDCGYQGDVGWTAPVTQIVQVNTSIEGGGNIYALLNKPFSMGTSSEWQSFVPAPIELADTLFQGVTSLTGNQTSLFGQYTSRRIWRGTSALKMTLELYFYAVNDAYNEVLEPCIRLQRLALPTYKLGNATSGFSLLTPPGPNPFSFNTGQTPGGEIVTITIGGLITFTPVIVKEPLINFDQKYDRNGNPMSATAIMQFETYQLLTKEDLSGMVTPNLPGAGSGTATTSNTPLSANN